MTPQIDHLRKTSPVLRVSTHIYGVSKEIDGKMFIFRVNLGMWPLKLMVSDKWALFWGFQHTFMVFPRRYMGKMFIFRVNLGMWPLKSIVLEKRALFWWCQHTFMAVVQGDRWGNMFIFRVNLGMWPIKFNCLGKTRHCYEGFNAHLWGFSGDKPRHGNPSLVFCFYL